MKLIVWSTIFLATTHVLAQPRVEQDTTLRGENRLTRAGEARVAELAGIREQQDEGLQGRNGSLEACRQGATANFACGECETPLQDDFNSLLATITGSPTDADGRWSGDFTNQRRLLDNWPGTQQPITVESTLERIRAMMLENAPGDQNPPRLNYMIIGESESLQPSGMGNGQIYPRIAIKSPNSELWVTFNTDPASAAYNTLEIMRWNGREARYEFTELNFARPGQGGTAPPADSNHAGVEPGEPRSMDGTGRRCMTCHKSPDPRPNWETYRAWSGIVPSRDDMLESRNGSPSLDSSMYLRFMDQVATAPAGSRLSMLDIPVDSQVQMPNWRPPTPTPAYGSTAWLNQRQADMSGIRNRFQEAGYYRIPHFPQRVDMGGASNFDGKTALLAGSSQLAFDQLSGQNMCRISTRLQEDPDYNKFKWFLAGMKECFFEANGQTDITPEALAQWLPEGYQQEIARYFSTQPSQRLSDLADARTLPSARDLASMDYQQMYGQILADTEANHRRANQFKHQRHTRLGAAYIRNFGNNPPMAGLDPAQGEQRPEACRTQPTLADQQACTFATRFTAPVRDDFHAIGDDAGVNGVGEGHPSTISSIRSVLEPLGIDVGQWSMMRGGAADSTYDSLAFSDQFALFLEQRAVTDAVAAIENDPLYQSLPVNPASGERDKCEALRQASLRDLAGQLDLAPSVGPAPSPVVASAQDVENACREIEVPGAPDIFGMNDIFAAEGRAIESMSRDYFQVCFSCHGQDPSDSGGIQFPGMENLNGRSTWSNEAWAQFNNYLRTGTAVRSADPIGRVMAERLREHAMPPEGWPDSGTDPAAKRAEDNRRSNLLARYVEYSYAQTGNVAAQRELCNALEQERGVGERGGRSIGAPGTGAGGR
jgi:hypothetical protein